jgi:SAM-dependent methyltransferase
VLRPRSAQPGRPQPPWRSIGRRTRIHTIDLHRTLIGGEGPFDAGRWAEATGNPRRASTLLQDSPHVQFLEAYRRLGGRLLEAAALQQTAYFRNAAESVRLGGSYFGHRTPDGIAAQARAFVRLYERMAANDATEVEFPHRQRHSPSMSLPVVRETLTPNTYQIVDGHHRLAAAWALGRRSVPATVRGRRTPTTLQALALACAQTQGRRELYQPVRGVEFDESWTVVRGCDDRLAMMLAFLASRGRRPDGLSVLDLACSYGWFVNEFSKRGSEATGVDADPSALKIGQIAYGLRPEQLVQGDLQTFLSRVNRTWDVVLLLSVLHHFARNPRRGRAEMLLREADRVTGFCLFLDMGQAHEEWFRGTLRDWDDEFVIDFIRRHTSFSHVMPLGADLDHRGRYRGNYARTLFVCVRDP